MSNDNKEQVIEQPKNTIGGLTSQVMNNPEALALMQSKLAGMVGTLSGYYDTLPTVVKRRVKALKKVQVETLSHEAKLHEEIHALECKYASLYKDLFKKRCDIVNGLYEPTEEESDYPSDSEEQDGDSKKEGDLSEDVKTKVNIENENGKDENAKGIPNFWLTIFKNVEIIAENIQEHDEPILDHLADVTVKLEENPMGFTISFHFSPNKYFTNEILTKYYELSCKPDEKDPFSFEGPEILKSKGCEINWNKNENVTIKTVNKKQKHKSKGSVRTVQKTVPNDSFFNFFCPPEVLDNEEDIDDDTQALLAADFEIGEIIRQRLVPRAVLYFTGEALVDDEYDDEEEDEEDDESQDSDDDDEDEKESPQKGKKPPTKRIPSEKNAQGNPQECKQQ